MKHEIKEKWVEALRSGEYSQTTGVLRDDIGFCCLGVLCDLHQKETGEGEWLQPKINKRIYYLDGSGVRDSGVLTPKVMEWAGLDMDNFIIDGDSGYAAIINDNGATFAYIADLIEKNL